MIYERLEAILAYTPAGVIGVDDKIPWHHHGDMKRFKAKTSGHSLLMGAKTFIGIAKNYFGESKPVLPGRKLIILGVPRNFSSLQIDIEQQLAALNRVYEPGALITIDEREPHHDGIERALSLIEPSQKLFLAGGARVYDKYLVNCKKIYKTVIHPRNDWLPPGNSVKLDAESMFLLQNESKIYTESEQDYDDQNSLVAHYTTLTF